MKGLYPPLGRWDPAPLTDVAARFSRAGSPWWVAGGFAIGLAVGRRVRSHDDIDVLLLRRDQLVDQQVLAGWQWWAADPPGSLRPWAPGETLPSASTTSGAGRAPRPPAGRRPRRHLRRRGADVQLFYKARTPRPKDEQDFDAALPVLTERQRGWLADAITDTYGPPPWLGRLRP
ncbi:nucleotidyltransferase domain-containing protein [Streptomyces sp. Ac-502]|uniref:nucleotidyltransferase domain-containing protein n=1 Tax=Streptomyces sp. Ac-502 TaxID=3342801 RepID=UPI0038629353